MRFLGDVGCETSYLKTSEGINFDFRVLDAVMGWNGIGFPAEYYANAVTEAAMKATLKDKDAEDDEGNEASRVAWGFVSILVLWLFSKLTCNLVESAYL